MIKNLPSTTALSCVALLALAGCGPSDRPGAIEGRWVAREPFPVTVTFRKGEMESMGNTKKVSYERTGNDVLVTYLEGATKGKTFRYTVVDADTLRSESGTFRRSE
jgi:hypothetical protein